MKRSFLFIIINIFKEFDNMGMCSNPTVGKEPKKNKEIKIKSAILNGEGLNHQFQKQIIRQIAKSSNSPYELNLIFRASESNFEAQKFYEAVDGIGDTLILVKTVENRIFGGYSPCKWKKNVMYTYENDANGQSFLFSLTSNQNNIEQRKISEAKENVDLSKEQILGEGKAIDDKKVNGKRQKKKQQLPIEANQNKTKKVKESQKSGGYIFKKLPIFKRQNAIMSHSPNGPVFGEGHDIFISDRCNKNINWCNVGKSYTSPFEFGSKKGNTLMAGKTEFLVAEYQVWQFKF